MPTIIRIDQEIGYWGISARDIKMQLAEAEGDIVVEINSPGGSVIEGISIFNAFKDYDKGRVDFVIVGLAASMASYIPLSGDSVKAYDNAIYMIHNAWGVAIGDYREMENRAKVLNGMNSILRKAYVNKTDKEEKDVISAMDSETYYFGQEILDNGFVDEIISTDKDKDSDSALSLAKEQFKACVKNIEANAKEEDYEQIAAIVKDYKSLVENPSASAGKIENKTKENEEMATPETQTDVMTAEDLETARTDAVSAERKRVSDIMALSGSQDVKNQAIQNGLSVGDTAIELNKSLATATTTEKNDFENAAAEVAEVSTQAEASSQESEEDKAWREAEQNIYGGKK